MNDRQRKAMYARKKRIEEIDRLTGSNQENDDYFTIFPKCPHCNPNGRVVIIPNTNPVVESKKMQFSEDNGIS